MPTEIASARRRTATAPVQTFKGAVVNYANNGVANAATAELVRLLAKQGVDFAAVTDSRMVEYDTQVVVMVDEVADEVANTINEHEERGTLFIVLNHRSPGWERQVTRYGAHANVFLIDIAAPHTTQDVTAIGGVIEALWDIEFADRLTAWVELRKNS